MRALLLSISLSLALVTSGSAQDGRSAAIEDVIQSQIDAFLDDDFETAFTYASPGIRGIFGTSERFGAMVRNGYPMVWRPSSVEFLELREINGRFFQKVLVTDAAGMIHVLDYQMIDEGNGWQINGVQILRQPQIGA